MGHEGAGGGGAGEQVRESSPPNPGCGQSDRAPQPGLCPLAWGFQPQLWGPSRGRRPALTLGLDTIAVRRKQTPREVPCLQGWCQSLDSVRQACSRPWGWGFHPLWDW